MIVYLQMIETDEDKVRFERVYNAYRGLMYYVAYGILKNEEDAEDAVHQAFVSIIENLEKISEAECPKTRAFCVIVVERKALDMLRRRRGLAGAYEVELAGVEVPMPVGSELEHALARLPARYREVLLLRFFLGYSTKEVAEILQISHAAALKLVSRAKGALARELEREGETHG